MEGEVLLFYSGEVLDSKCLEIGHGGPAVTVEIEHITVLVDVHRVGGVRLVLIALKPTMIL